MSGGAVHAFAVALAIVVSFAILALWSRAVLELHYGGARVRRLADVDAATLPDPAPRVTVVIAARDEERHLASAMRSVLALDYPALEVIAVDDRSTDRTGTVLDQLATADPRLRVIHVRDLPAGWLGKTHALHVAAQAAAGEWVLFTDADVFFAPDTLRRALALAVHTPLDHLVLGPRTTGGTVVMRLLLGFFALGFALSTRPWRAREADRSEHIGIGAFNLVRADVYRAVGGHSRIAMRPDDDIKLGKIIKDAGYAQEMLFGRGLMSVEWYPSLGALARGLEKNSLAGVDYSVAAMLAGTLAQLVFFVWPFAALAVTTGAALALNAAACAVLLSTYVVTAHLVGAPRWYAMGFPVMAVIFVGILWRATFITLHDGGITWRGTRYPLAALKANRV